MKVRRRQFIGLVGSTAALWPVRARAQQKKVPRVGVLTSGSTADTLDSTTSRTPAALRQGLRALGYIEGQNIQLEFRTAAGQFDRLPALAAELVELQVDIIVAGATPAARAAQRATRTIPIVATAMGDPVLDGLVTSYAAPGGNITGNTFLGPELVSKRLAYLKELLPSLVDVGVLWHPHAFGEHTMAGMLREAKDASGALGLQLRFASARGPEDFVQAFATFQGQSVGAVFQFPSVMLFTQRKRIVDLAAKNALAAMFGAREFVELGGLVGYGASIDDLNVRGAGFVNKIIRGAKPADLPVEQPTKFEFLINLKTAAALGLMIPPTLLARADEVIE